MPVVIFDPQYIVYVKNQQRVKFLYDYFYYYIVFHLVLTRIKKNN